MGDELLLTGNQGTRWRWNTLNGRTLKICLLSLANLVKVWFSTQTPNSEGWIRVRIGKNIKNSWQRGGDYFKSGNKMTRQINGFSEGGGSLALCVLHARQGERKASWPDVLVCNCGCGVWLCGRSEKSCHVAFPFRSHLPGEKRLFVRLPQTVTAWQLRFHQSQQRGGRIGCLEKMYNCVSGVHVLFTAPPILACALLQYACECVKYENLMKPTGGARLQYVMFFYSLRRRFDESGSFIFKSLLEKVERQEKKVLTFLPGCHQNW